MKNHKMIQRAFALTAAVLATLTLTSAVVFADDDDKANCAGLPSAAQLKEFLEDAAAGVCDQHGRRRSDSRTQ